MKNQRKTLKKQLDKEMNHITFSKQQEVIDRLHPVSFKQKALLIWNKEIELSLLPLVAIVVVILSLGIKYNDVTPDNVAKTKDEMVEIDEYRYWKDDLEKMVTRYEN
ncbi:hypothetical protein J6TS1_16390 [Siminovitchia terrae]|uniref:Uncharacterized protein n=1 Tax=Siminovitchia terrae TaxID=1914933 RepID=A0ABQ4KVT1_SIMTE|nr:hypothetical protein [Siminovitchia terrae]GIN91678.1 hypothetical protein J22TS1_27290 [Siminovitchia terrae]GIN95769.1 hypothetical protein J6TS1_16390 [Siminovitchia terrae]